MTTYTYMCADCAEPCILLVEGIEGVGIAEPKYCPFELPDLECNATWIPVKEGRE